MTRKAPMFWYVLAAQALFCFAVWRSSPYNHLTSGMEISWFLAGLVAAFVLAAFTDTSKRAILGGVIVAALAANMANVMVDWTHDKTSHNLFPFELAITAVVNLVAAAAGMGIGRLMRPKP